MYSVYNAGAQDVEIEGVVFKSKQVVNLVDIPKAAGPQIAAGILQVNNYDSTTRLYDWDKGLKMPVGVSSLASEVINANEVMLVATKPMLIRAGADPTAADGPGNAPLLAGEKFHLQIIPGQKIAAIRMGTEDGFLFIVPCR